jgi:hypothetical protein
MIRAPQRTPGWFEAEIQYQESTKTRPQVFEMGEDFQNVESALCADPVEHHNTLASGSMISKSELPPTKCIQTSR